MTVSHRLQRPRKVEKSQLFSHVTCKVVRHIGWVSPFRATCASWDIATWCPQLPEQQINQTPGGVKLLAKLKFIKIRNKRLAPGQLLKRKKTYHKRLTNVDIK